MDTPSSTPIAPHLEPVLRRLRQRIRRILSSRGALITTVTALAGLLALVALDSLFSPLPAAIRWLSPFVWLAGVAASAFVAWLLPLRKPLDLVRIARWLETRHPDLDERISTVLECSGHTDSGMSSQLIDELAREAAGSLGRINPQVEVSTRRARHWLWPAAALLLAWGVLFAVWPDLTARHLVRALVPTSTLGNAAGRITVTPGSIELIEGDALLVTARQNAGSRMLLELVMHLPDGYATVMPMEPRADESIYQIGRASGTFDYEVRGGRFVSDRYRVTVWPRPLLVKPRIRLEFPAYTGWAARELELGGDIAAITGTKVELHSKLNTPVHAVRLEIDGETAGTTTLQPAADGGDLTSCWTLEKAGRSNGRVMLKHRLGREFETARFMIESQPDAPPDVKWLGTAPKEQHVRKDELLEREYTVTDDVGLGTLQLEIQPENGNATRLPVDAPPRTGTDEAPAWRGRIHQAVADLTIRWPQSRGFKLRVRAEDSRPANLGGPGVGTSEWMVIRVDDGAPTLARQNIAAAQADARETIEQARQLVQQSREKIDRRRPELNQEKIPEAARKELTQARDQLDQAREKLDHLAGRMAESVMADKVPAVRKAAETIAQAKQQLEDAPLQDTPPQRDQSAAAARESAENAQRQLEKLREDLQRGEPQLQEYARLKELEQQQRELARQAEQALAQNPQDPAKPAKPPESWQQQQNQVAEALRQDAQQHPNAQQASLEQQAKDATQLANEARQQAAAQEALQQAAKDPSAASPALRDQLAKEQADITREARQELAEARERQDNRTANILPEAVASGENASKALAEPNEKTAANEAQQAASQLDKAAKAAAGKPQAGEKPAAGKPQTGEKPSNNQADAGAKPGGSEPAGPSDPSAAADLSDLARRQQQVAGALDALAQNKPAEAAAKLAEMRAQQTAELAADVRNAPQVNNPSGPMQQAAQSSQQAAGQAQQAAQAGAQGKPADASSNHGQAAQQLSQAASQLSQAAGEFSQQAAQAADRTPGPQQAPVPAQPLAEAFQQASRAADSNNQTAAASQARAAAQALAQATAGTLSALQGQAPNSPGTPGQPKPPGQPNQPGTNPDEGPRTPQANPGVPPELAKLGISAEDWEKIKTALKTEVGGSSTIALPEEYRDLVRRYFEEISKNSNR